MTIKAIITLKIKKGERKGAYSILNESNTIQVKKDTQNDTKLVCITEIENDKAEDVFSTFKNIFNINGLEKIELFSEMIPQKKNIDLAERLSPFIPMTISSFATFLVLYNVIGILGSNTFEDIINFAGIPTAITFLIQLGTITKSKWTTILKKIQK